MLGSVESLVDLADEVFSGYTSEEWGSHPSFVKEPVDDKVISCVLLEVLHFD